MDTSQSPGLIKRPPWLTVGYITEVLRKGENDANITVNNIEDNFLVNKGDNYASVVHKITIAYCDGKGKQAKKPLIIKSTHENPVMQRFVKDAHLFDKELYTYGKLFPTMASLTDKPLVSPKLYPTEREDVVILEDMSSRGFRMADRKKRLDFTHSSLVVKTLGRFHGLSLAVLQRDPSIVDHFPESMFTERMREMNSKFMPKMYESLVSVVGTWPGYERFSEKLSGLADGFLDKMEEMVVPEKNAFNVLNHGDCWTNNMLFRYNDDTKVVEEVCLIDLQVVRYGSPALDLQYFFAMSLADGVREEYEEVLLEEYHKALTDTLRAVNLSSIKYSLEDLKRDFQEKTMFGFNTSVLFLGAMVADSNDTFDVDGLTEEALESGSIEGLEKSFQGERSKAVLQKLLVFYENRGFI